MSPPMNMVCSLSNANKAIIFVSPLYGFNNSFSRKRNAIVVNKNYNICFGLMQNCVHPSTVICLNVMLK